MALDKNIEAFVMHMTTLSLNLMPIHPVQKAQIILLVAKKVQILNKYLDFSDIFLDEKALILPKTIKLNQYVINLQEGQQPSFGLNYNLGLVKLKR